MAEPDRYLLGRSSEEEVRLRRQMADIAKDSDGQLDRIGIKPGERVIDMGCGPGGALDLLSRRVGPTGSVTGMERSPNFVGLARKFAAEMGLSNVTVVEGDVYAPGLPERSFDGAHMRLVLVNVPRPDHVVRQLVALVKPGGWVASLEAGWHTFACDPPHPAWARLFKAFSDFSSAQGIDLNIGAKTHRLFRDAGLADIAVDLVARVHPAGHFRRVTLISFVNNVR